MGVYGILGIWVKRGSNFDSMIQSKTIELFTHLRVDSEGVYTGIALYDNANVV
jgi:hypothetical protein